MSATATTPLRYRGANNNYLDIAVRKDQHLGFSLQYAPHPHGVGYFIARFVVHSDSKQTIHSTDFTHLTYRAQAEFLIPASESNPSHEVFEGARLNKIALPVCQPPVYRHEIAAFVQEQGLLPLVTKWVTAQVEAEGFTLTVPDLEAEIRAFLTLPQSTGPVKMVLNLPDLKAPEQKAAALKLVEKPEPEDEDDEDGDEEKTWLN